MAETGPEADCLLLCMVRWIAAVYIGQNAWLLPLTLPPFTDPHLIGKTGRSFSGVEEPMNDQFQGCRPLACSAETLWEADLSSDCRSSSDRRAPRLLWSPSLQCENLCLDIPPGFGRASSEPIRWNLGSRVWYFCNIVISCSSNLWLLTTFLNFSPITIRSYYLQKRSKIIVDLSIFNICIKYIFNYLILITILMK